MLWFYWRRARVGILAAFVALAAAMTLILVVGSASPSEPRTQAKKVTAATRSGAQTRHAPAPVKVSSIRRGTALMSAAVAACRTVSYAGAQLVAWWGGGTSTAYLIDVWHRSGEPEIADAAGSADGDGAPGSIARPGAAASDHAASGVLSVSSWMLRLLRTNYLIEYAGPGAADGRMAQIVSVRRRDGSLAARYWLDHVTGLPLRRELFDARGRLVNEGAFLDLSIGRTPVPAQPAGVVQAWSTQPVRSDLATLRAQGWSIPATLAGDMTLIGVSRSAISSGAVVDASYSDGLSIVSVFMQRGELAGGLPGWQPARVRGKLVYSSQPDLRSLAWSAHDVVYTVISDAPQRTVDQVVIQLPHDRGDGLWQRINRGLRRIASWFDPFG